MPERRSPLRVGAIKGEELLRISQFLLRFGRGDESAPDTGAPAPSVPLPRLLHLAEVVAEPLNHPLEAKQPGRTGSPQSSERVEKLSLLAGSKERQRSRVAHLVPAHRLRQSG